MEKKLRWHRGNGLIGGVCEGLASAFDLDTWLIRLIFLTALLFFGTGLGLYILLWAAFPKGNLPETAYQKRFLGVCSRVAKATDIEVGVVRLGAILLTLCSFGPGVVGYFILYFVVPNPKQEIY